MRRALLAVLLLLVAGLAFDEKTVAATLAGLGSTFIRGENLTRREINAKLAELDAKIDPGDTVFFFFAGHGGAWCRELSSAARPSEATSSRRIFWSQDKKTWNYIYNITAAK